MREALSRGGAATSGRRKRVARRLNAWICFSDECGQTLRAGKAGTWAPRVVTPILKVTAAGRVRVSVAGLVCYRPGQRSRLIYRTMLHRGRKGERKGFREPDLTRLHDAAHRQLGGPTILVWDRRGTHTPARTRALIAARPWLRAYRPPTYTPELNPTTTETSHTLTPQGV